MENTIFNIEVKEAFHVTKDGITPTQAFVVKEVGTYGTADKIYYLSEKGWNVANSWSDGKEVAYTEKDAQELKVKKMESHLKWLRESKSDKEKEIADLETQLGK